MENTYTVQYLIPFKPTYSMEGQLSSKDLYDRIQISPVLHRDTKYLMEFEWLLNKGSVEARLPFYNVRCRLFVLREKKHLLFGFHGKKVFECEATWVHFKSTNETKGMSELVLEGKLEERLPEIIQLVLNSWTGAEED